MRYLKRLILILAAAALIVIVVCLIRTLRFTAVQKSVAPIAAATLDAGGLAQRLSEAIRLRTISCQDPSQFDGQPFVALHQYIEQTFPRVHAALKREVVSQYSLLFTWPGGDPASKPLLLVAHQDVVPVAEDAAAQWTHPAFDGVVADGFVWGRGALDDKSSLMGILEAVDALLRDGFQPKRTIYLGFGHDEEVGGSQGAPKIAELLQSRNVRLGYVIDEGSGIVQGVVPGVAKPIAAIGIAEKGYLSLELTVESEGGHSSTPPRHTAIGILAHAIAQIEDHPFPADLTQAGRFFKYVAPEMPFLQRAVFANLWLTAPLVERLMSGNPNVNASIRTTAAATIFNAGFKENVLPAKAKAVVNFRLLPGDTISRVSERVRKTIRDDRVHIAALGKPSEPSPVSDLQSQDYQTIEKTLLQTAAEPGTVVAPFLVLGATDARHYAPLADNVFRFLPITLNEEDLKRMHGVNERVSVEAYTRMVQFYAQLIRNSN